MGVESRRAVWGLAPLFALFVLASTQVALAQAPRRDRLYVNELAIVLEGSRRVLLWAEAHPGDAELAKFIYPLSEHYVQLAGRMSPSEPLRVVHPHLLLVVENIERAVDAAARGDLPAFRQRIRIVREELSMLEGVLKHLKVRLPESSR